jgi:cytochrome P450
MDPEHVALADIDLSDPELWLAPRDHRERVFRTLRDEAPVQFFEEVEFPPFAKGPGYFAITRYEDVWMASRNPQLFCSGRGTVIPDMPIEIAEFFGSMISMDDPRHYRLRSSWPRRSARSSARSRYVRDKADGIVDTVLEKYLDGACDFVDEVAAPLPLQIICEMMGIPDEDERQVFAWTNTILGAGDPDYGADFGALLEHSMAMNAYAIELGTDRLANPRDDLTTALMHAEVDGERLTTAEFGSFFILLVVAGNETTRNAISHGIKALTEHPDQRTLWWDDPGTRRPR